MLGHRSVDVGAFAGDARTLCGHAGARTMKADSTEPLVEVFVARDVPHNYLVKMGLDVEGVFSVIQGENLQIAMGDVPVQDAAPRIRVRKPEVARALQILRENGERP